MHMDDGPLVHGKVSAASRRMFRINQTAVFKMVEQLVRKLPGRVRRLRNPGARDQFWLVWHCSNRCFAVTLKTTIISVTDTIPQKSR